MELNELIAKYQEIKLNLSTAPVSAQGTMLESIKCVLVEAFLESIEPTPLPEVQTDPIVGDPIDPPAVEPLPVDPPSEVPAETPVEPPAPLPEPAPEVSDVAPGDPTP